MKRAITNCKMIDVQTGLVQENMSIFWIDGVIQQVGPNLDLPSDVEIIDGRNYIVTPGLINGFTQAGLEEFGVRWEGEDGYEASGPMQLNLSVVDGINPFDKSFSEAVAAGVTTVHVSPGPENVISGITAILKTYGTVADQMVVEGAHGLAVSMGDFPRRAFANKHKKPLTRMGIASMIREQLRKTQMNLIHTADSHILRRVIRKEAPMYIQAHRVDDLLTAIRLKEEFDLDIVFVHGTEAGEIIDALSKHAIPVLAGPFYVSNQSSETRKLDPFNAVRLHRGQIPFGIVAPIVRNLTVEGALTIREGLPERDALYAMTLGTARILGVDDRIGSIEAGKDADLVLWNGKPLELTAPIHQTIINGETVYQRKEA